MTLMVAMGGLNRVSIAEGPISFVLDYQVAPGIKCPDRADVEAMVLKEVGRPIFDGPAEQQAILTIALSDGELIARIAFTSASTGGPAYRTVSAPLQDCRDLVRIFALLVALRAQGVEPEPEPEVEPKEIRPRRLRSETQAAAVEQKPVADAPPVAQPVARPEVVKSGAKTETAAHSSPWLALTVGSGLRTGFAPHVNPALRLGVVADTSTAFRIQAELEGVGGGQHAVNPKGAYRVSGAAFIVSTCWSPHRKAAVSLAICPVLSATLVQVAGEGLDVSQTDRAFGTTGGLDARVRMALSDQFYIEAVLGGAFNPRPHTVWVGGDKAWKSEPFWFNSVLLLGYRPGATPASRAPAADLSTTTVPSKQ